MTAIDRWDEVLSPRWDEASPQIVDEETEEKTWRDMGRAYRIAGESVTLYPIGALAAALGKRPVTIRSWENKGWMPKPRLRGPVQGKGGRRRLYTEAQVLGLIAIARRHGLLSGGVEADWVQFHADVTELYERTL